MLSAVCITCYMCDVTECVFAEPRIGPDQGATDKEEEEEEIFHALISNKETDWLTLFFETFDWLTKRVNLNGYSLFMPGDPPFKLGGHNFYVRGHIF